MKVKIPKEFKIGSVSVKVLLQPYLHSDAGFNGAWNKRTGELTLDPDIQNDRRKRVFGHELNEVIKDNYELDTDEREMSCFANGWIEFLSQLGIEFDFSEIK